MAQRGRPRRLRGPGQSPPPSPPHPPAAGQQLALGLEGDDDDSPAAARYDRFRVGARDVHGNGIQALTAGINWVLLQHLRIFAAFNYQSLGTRVPEIPGASSWGFDGGIAGYFLRGAGRGD